MTTYIVIEIDTGIEVYRYQAEFPCEWSGMEFSTHHHIEAPAINADGSIEGVVMGRVMTKLDFLRRFSAEERIAIRTVAKTNPVLEDYMAMIDLAQDIDTADTDTKTGVQMLESVGLIAAGRAQEILS